MNTKFDAYPLTRVDEALDLLGKAKVVSTLDQKAAFWSILMSPYDKEKTAFGTRSKGLLQFKRMPFGLKNATATYGRAISHVLRGLVWKHCVAYVDDTLVWGDSHDDHAENLWKVLKRFSINNVAIKLEKCFIACPAGNRICRPHHRGRSRCTS